MSTKENSNLQKYWNMVNNIKDLDEAENVIKELMKATGITIDEFDELMNTVAYLERELYHMPNRSFM